MCVSPSSSFIHFKDVYFYYKRNSFVLNGVNMQVNKGKIFALLGANGEGKSTMIKLMVGLLKPKYGKILIKGKEPGSKGLNIPGRGVGYMPQETALYSELTIEQLFYYYGYVFGMNDKLIEQRIRYLYENIDLKERDKTIGSLSGGQQRSVSMALTLIHSPELVIWDEPTVGLDPIKRDRMWRYLFRLCNEQGLTVLITTHYIEEAKRADQVAFIHQGICLEQNSPQKLLDKYKCSTLEDVSYNICRNYDKIEQTSSSLINPEIKSFNWNVDNLQLSWNHVWALFKKSSRQYNNFALFFLFIATPVFGLSMPYYVFGPPKTVPIGVRDADQSNLTRSFISNLDDDIMALHVFDHAESGISSVETVKNIMFADIPNGFTEEVIKIKLGQYEHDSENDSNVQDNIPNLIQDNLSLLLKSNSNYSMKLYLDMTNPVLSYYALVNSYSAFHQAIKENPSLFNYKNATKYTQTDIIPIKLQDPLLGSFSVEYKDSISCALLIIITFDHAMFLSSLVMMIEKQSGVANRDRVSGITKLEVVVSIFIFSIAWVLLAIISELITLVLFYNNFVMSNLFEASLLVLMVGAEGVLLGIILALVLDNIIFVGGIAGSLTLILLLMSGVVWPVLALPLWLKPLSTALPFTQLISSMQSLLISGLTISSLQVISGFYVSALYLLFMSFVIICLILFKK